MDPNEAYNLCCKFQGKRVRINDKGNVRFGTITIVETPARTGGRSD